MTRFSLIQPGSTDLDEQRRLKGCLDVPLSPIGRQQVQQLASDLAAHPIDAIYCAPCQSAVETARGVAAAHGLRVRPVENLCNLDLGLWHGKKIDELRRTQPKTFRMWQDEPQRICPPEGEPLPQAENRVRSALAKLAKKHKHELVAIVVPNPLASIVRCVLQQESPDVMWNSECDGGSWTYIGDPRHSSTMVS